MDLWAFDLFVGIELEVEVEVGFEVEYIEYLFVEVEAFQNFVELLYNFVL
jgi:hypothetical protein